MSAPRRWRERWTLRLLAVFSCGMVLWGASSGTRLAEHLQFLASDALKGRGNGAPELNHAARYIALHFARYGLLPAGESGGYFQEFEMATARRLGPGSRLQLRAGQEKVTLKAGKDYFPLAFGSREVRQAPLVFAGFGISAPELNYDDYRNLDVHGKIAVVFEHEPQEQVPGSVFAGAELSAYSATFYKIVNARERGAVGLFLLPDSFNHPGRKPPAMAGELLMEDLGIPALRLGEQWGEWLFRHSGRNPEPVIFWMDRHLTPYVFDLPISADLRLDVLKTRSTIKNVLGIIPGKSSETILVGAHYDHLGLGGQGSLAPESVGEIHNGADDNASGTAGLLELARLFSGSELPRSLLFAAFSGEELGLLGSRYYTEHPTVSLQRIVAMVNLDMIGRSQGSLVVGGVATASEFQGILDGLRRRSPLEFHYWDDSRGSSDHLSFAVRKIPALLFFSGMHSDYHRPSDDWEKIDLVRTGQVLEVVEQTVRALLKLPRAPRFVASREPALLSASHSRPRPYFGSIPDMSWEFEGIRFSEVIPQSPAHRAGLQPEDVLVAFEGRKVSNLHDFSSALQGKRPGDRVPVLILRKGQLLRATVTLSEP